MLSYISARPAGVAGGGPTPTPNPRRPLTSHELSEGLILVTHLAVDATPPEAASVEASASIHARG
jgi:hypothetical protein